MLTLSLFLACTSGDPEPIDPGSSTAPPDEGTLSVLTYNVHGLPDAITGDDGEARMRGIAPLLPDFDVIGVQESFDGERHQLLTAELSDHEVQDWSADKIDDSKAYGNGLGLMIRGWEEVERESFFYSTCHGLIDASSDCLASKGLQRVRVRVPGSDALLDLYNTHHEAGGGEEDIAARAAQVEEVVAAMASTDVAVIFVGDMNMHIDDAGDDEQLARYESVGLRDACTEVGCAEPDHIDRIWVRDGADLSLTVDEWFVDDRFFDDDGVPLSDHPAVSATVTWTR